MDFGYMGKILRVDLTNQTMEDDSIRLDIRKKYLGGRGLGLWLLTQEIQDHVDPYSEENVLIFMTGPYTGTGVFSAFYNVTTISPLTGLAASCHSGGTWGPSLKRAGYDAVIVKGRAHRPCYLLLEDNSCRIMDAQSIWGRGVRDTELFLQDRHGKKAVASIGPAGENLVRFASIMNDIHRAAGRGGVGAVMGSKNLKAIVAGGSQKVQYHNREAFMRLSREGGKKALTNGKAFGKYGTSMVFSVFNAAGSLPTYNFRAGHFERADEINADALRSRYFVKNHGCFNCPLKCANIHSVPDGPFAVAETEGPEYETMMAFGSNCGNVDLASIIKANDVCNDLGMDTISAGNTVALLFDLYEKDAVDEKLSKGLDLTWGNGETIIRVLEMMARREGPGDLLAEGSLKAAQHFGKEYEKYVIHAKGQEFPGYEVRRANGTGLSFATSSRGGDHLRGCFYVEEILKGEFDPYGFGDIKINTLIEKENFMALVDSLVMCKFGQRNGEFTLEVLPELLTHLTGIDFSADDLRLIGERIYTSERLYNAPSLPGPDVLPQRLFEEDLDDGLPGGARIAHKEFETAVSRYYQKRQWDSVGRPTVQKIQELDIE